MIQVDPPKNPTANARTLTTALMIYGPFTERKLRVMMKHGQRP